MRPTLRQLQYLIAVAEHKRFGAAARALNVSQPSLSAQIAEVEQHLGASLVERGRGGAVMTPAGEELVARARVILRQVEDLKSAVRRGEGVLAGRIRLGVLHSVGPYLLPLAIKRLHALHPELRLSIRDDSTIGLEAQLQDGRIDAAVSTAEDHLGAAHETLCREELWLCAAPDDPLSAAAAPADLSALRGRTLLTLGFGHRLATIVRRIADAAEGRVSAEYEGTSLDALRQMAATGAGVAILPSLYALSEVRRDSDLVLRRIDHPLAHRDISLVWRETSPLARDFAELARLLRETAQQLLRRRPGV